MTVVINVADKVDEFASMANNTLVDVKDVLNTIRPVVEVADRVLDDTEGILRDGVNFLNSINPVLPPLREARAFMALLKNLTFVVDTVVGFIEPVTGTIEKFLRTHLMQKVLTVRSFLVTVQVYIGKFESLADLVRSTVRRTVVHHAARALARPGSCMVRCFALLRVVHHVWDA